MVLKSHKFELVEAAESLETINQNSYHKKFIVINNKQYNKCPALYSTEINLKQV